MSRGGKKSPTNVFINCPFDDDYIPLLRPLLFTVVCAGYDPRIASERFDSGEARISKIVELISKSSLSIHDLSRIKAQEKDEVFRLNMPFELGLDMGYRLSKRGAAKRCCLILEKEPYTYQQALSDLSGSDIKSHNNDPENLVLEVRNWFVQTGDKNIPSGTQIWSFFNEFMADFYQDRQREGFREKDLEMMPVAEFINFIRRWLHERSCR